MNREELMAVQRALGHLRHCAKVGSLNKHDGDLVSFAVAELESITSGGDFQSSVDKLREDLTGLLFMWNNYVKADPATLTEDAKALAWETKLAFLKITGAYMAEAVSGPVKPGH